MHYTHSETTLGPISNQAFSEERRPSQLNHTRISTIFQFLFFGLDRLHQIKIILIFDFLIQVTVFTLQRW